MEATTQIIEIQGVKMEVDMRYAKRIEHLRIGSRVKVLVKQYSDYKIYPGIIIGFEPFPTKPSILIAYLDVNYNNCELKFISYNVETKDHEIVADLTDDAIELNKADIMAKFENERAKKQLELDEINRKEKYFLDNFGVYFEQRMQEA